ncbi:MAG TPA: CDP-diacylglycerol diphosphatase [Rhodospirillaceae bacterium]|nr:CDP-diacylglycerol diphosphatase [Rhodospirillaceae bacterium]
MKSSATETVLLVLLAFALISGLGVGPVAASDPDALWKIVKDQCLAHYFENGSKDPCTDLDPDGGRGYAVLKDRVGIAQFLLIPTKRLGGIESPELLKDDAPNYWAYAWKTKSSVADRLQRPLSRDQVVLTINSAFGRSQNQLHIHIDCIRADIHDLLRRHLAEIGDRWAPLKVRLDNHPYWARRVLGTDLDGNNPFRLLAEGFSLDSQAMARRTLAVTGAMFNGEQEGFVLLTDQVDFSLGNLAHGEELQDHDCKPAVP